MKAETIEGVNAAQRGAGSMNANLAALMDSVLIGKEAEEAIPGVASLIQASLSVRQASEGVSSMRPIVGIAAPTGVVALDDPTSDEGYWKDLQTLLLKLETETDLQQMRQSQERVSALMDQIKRVQQDRCTKLEESLKAMDKAAKKAKAKKIFGWVFTVLTLGISLAVCVASGGAAAGPMIAAAVALAFQVMDEAGVTEKIVNALASALEKLGLDTEKAKMLAQVLLMAIELAMMLVGGGVGSALSKAASLPEKLAQMKEILNIALGVLGLANAGLGIEVSVCQYKAAKAKAELLKVQAALLVLQQFMEEELEMLEKLTEYYQDKLMAVLSITTEEVEAKNRLVMNFSEAV